ncbi:MAG: hypothetical protein FWE01_02580 [Firmicutes bacterium]|nr:hypothetical protein [Bacillota bacterium]
MLKFPKQELEGEVMSRTEQASDNAPVKRAPTQSSPSSTTKPQSVQNLPLPPPKPPQTVANQPTIGNNLSQSNTTKPQSIFGKIRKIKNIHIYAVAAVILIMIVIYASSFLGGGGSGGSNNRDLIIANTNAFAREMEQQLTRTIKNMNGVGNVSVMLTVIGSPTMEIAYNVEERTVTQTGPNGQTTTTTTIVRTPILVGGNPIIIQQFNPRILGVIVVAQGAHDIGIRLNILRAVQAIVADANANIEVLPG